VYFWVDGIYVQARLEDETQCLLVIIGATPEGKKELVGLADGLRESAQSWRELLLDLKRRGLSSGPQLAVGDGALGFWKALDEVWPNARAQRCWVHKAANILNKLPNSLHGKAKRALHNIWMAETRNGAEAAFDAFIETYGCKYEKAVECLIKDRDTLLASTTSPPSTGGTYGLQIRSRAPLRPFGIGRRDRRVASQTRPRSPLVEGLIWSFCLAFGRTPPVAVAVVVPRSGAKSPGTFAVGWRPRPSGRRHSGRG
jgi:Transposase, Mutator family